MNNAAFRLAVLPPFFPFLPFLIGLIICLPGAYGQDQPETGLFSAPATDSPYSLDMGTTTPDPLEGTRVEGIREFMGERSPTSSNSRDDNVANSPPSHDMQDSSRDPDVRSEQSSTSTTPSASSASRDSPEPPDSFDTPPRSVDRQQWLNMNATQRRTFYIILGAIAVLLLIPAIAWIQKRSHTYVLPQQHARQKPPARVTFQPMRPKTLSRSPHTAPPATRTLHIPEIAPGSRLRGAIPKTPRIPSATVEGFPRHARPALEHRVSQLTQTAQMLGDVVPETRLRIIDALEICIDQIQADSRHRTHAAQASTHSQSSPF